VDGFRDEVGLCAVIGDPRAVHVVRAALAELRHRGGDGFTLVAADGERLQSARGTGPIGASHAADDLAGIDASGAVGAIGAPAVNGGTDGLFVARWSAGPAAVAFAGRLARAAALRREAEGRGAVFTTEGSAELLLHTVAASGQKSAVNRLVDALQRVDGGFSTVWLGPDRLIAARDPRGIRPLVWGRLGSAVIVASESGPLVALGATAVRDLEPGEMLVAAEGSVHTLAPFPRRQRAICLREWTSVARADSTLSAASTHAIRDTSGELLFRDFPAITADAVTGLPADPGSAGYARAAKLPLVPMLVGDAQRPTVVESAARGRKIVLVLPELVAGDAVRAIVGRLRAASALEVHVRVTSPPTRAACPYGVGDAAATGLAVADRPAPDRLAAWLGADSIQFVNASAVRAALATAAGQPIGLCEACFGGPAPAPMEDPKSQLDLFGARAP
jgi:amidophosphoribosyltransferase